jgi:DNA-binding NtrC family response regulator
MAPDRLESQPSRLLVVATAKQTDEWLDASKSSGLEARGLGAASDAPAVIAAWKPDVLVVDAAIGPPGPAELIRLGRLHAPNCVSVLVVPSVCEAALAVMQACGADLLFPAPLDRSVVRRALSLRSGSQPAAVPGERSDLVVGSSAAMQELWRLTMLAASTHASVLIRGETGAGKEVIARALHRFSPRRDRAFVAVNCGALPETLLESELFGHEKGAFTGATARHRGRFELAHGGTLFLDEIGDMPLALQVKLLRVLQEHSFERVGGGEMIPADVRVVAATHRNLEQDTRCGRFRLDLFYRLNVLSVHVPPLRQRTQDILPLWESFLRHGAAALRQQVPKTSSSVQRMLLRHDWPGNVRELENAAQHALTLATGDSILPADLPGELTARAAVAPARGLLGRTLKELERDAIFENLQALGSVDAAAKALGVSPRKIYYRLSELKQQEARPDLTAAEADRAKARVVFAEDDDDLRIALAASLKAEGYEVLPLRDGNAVLEHLGASLVLERRDTPMDILVTDLRMPGVTGLQLLEGLRARGWRQPIVLISAFADDALKERALAQGATAFLEKPVDVSDLTRIIEKALGAEAC